MARVYLFKRFERFWHWAQALLIVFLLVTGFDIHGTYSIMPWHDAVRLHRFGAWTLIVLWVFAIFWHFTTGEWRQYIPTTDRLIAVAKYYAFGIFTPGAHHPFGVTQLHKHNPLQRLAYLAFKLFISPLIWISGLLYMYFKDPFTAPVVHPIIHAFGLTLGFVAIVHTFAAFCMLLFFIGHSYMAFTGHPPLAYIKAMITGWGDAEEEPAQQNEGG